MNISARFRSSGRSVILLAPNQTQVRRSFRNVYCNKTLHAQLKGEMQRLRGDIYSAMGVLRPSDLSADGRHVQPNDASSWHLLVIDDEGSVAGCVRYSQHPACARFEELRVAHSALANSAEWGEEFRLAVGRELTVARRLGFSYVEVGGWAMADHVRGSAECLRSVLTTYAWSRLIGGALGISTATELNASAFILRKLGGRLLECRGTAIPPYFDAQYGCRMQMVAFDSRFPIPRYEQTVQDIMAALQTAPVLCGDSAPDMMPLEKLRPAASTYSAAAALAAAV